MKFDWPLVERPAHVPADRVVPIDIYNLPDAPDFHRAWNAFQRCCRADVVWTPHNGGHWVVASGSLIPLAYRDYERFSSSIVLVPKEVGEKYHFVPNTVDPPEHRKYRGLLSAGLSPRAVKHIAPAIRDRAGAMIESFRANGACDFVADFASRLPIDVFMEMCGLPAEDGPSVKYWADQFTRPDGNVTIEQATQALYVYLSGPIDARREQPTGDFLCAMVNGEVDGERLTREQALAVSAQALLGGLDTVANLLAFVMLHLARDPQLQVRLASDAGNVADAVEECLRRFPLATSTRVVAIDGEWGGAPLHAGDMIVIPSALHGLDLAENDSPLEFRLNRGERRHSTFGAGAHRCPGATLARHELTIVLEEWLRRIPRFAVAPESRIAWRGGVVASINTLPLVWSDNQAGSS